MVQAVGNVLPASYTLTLADLKTVKLATLQTIQAAALVSMPYAVGGVTYSVTIGVQDRVDLQEQLTILQAEPSGTTLAWEVVTGTYLEWDVSDLQALQNAGAQYILAVYANASSLTGQINAAADEASLSAIDLTQGWPT